MAERYHNTTKPRTPPQRAFICVSGYRGDEGGPFFLGVGCLRISEQGLKTGSFWPFLADLGRVGWASSGKIPLGWMPRLRRRLFAFHGMVGLRAGFLPSVLNSEDEDTDRLGRVENF